MLFVALLAGKIKEKKYECRPLNDYGFEFKEFYFYTNIRDGINEQKKDGTLWHDNKSGDESLCYAVFNEKNDFSWGIKFKKSCNVFGIKLYSPVLFTILLEPGRPFYNIDQNVIDIINRAFFHLKKPKWDILQSGAIYIAPNDVAYAVYNDDNGMTVVICGEKNEVLHEFVLNLKNAK